MARRAVRLLLLAIVLAAIPFHPDAVVEGNDAPARPEGDIADRCAACNATSLYVAAYSPVNKVPAISETLGIAQKVCKEVAGDVLLVFQDEEGGCNENCRTRIKSGLLEAIKHYEGLVHFIKKERRSIQDLKKYICKDSPHSAEGEDQNWLTTKIKNFGGKLKVAPLFIFHKLGQKKNPINQLAEACKKLNASLK